MIFSACNLFLHRCKLPATPCSRISSLCSLTSTVRCLLSTRRNLSAIPCSQVFSLCSLTATVRCAAAGAIHELPLRCSVRAFAIHFSDLLPQPGRVAIWQTVNFLLQAAFADCPYLINRNLRRPASALDLQPCPPSRMELGGQRTDDNRFQAFVHLIRADRNNRPCLAYLAADSRIEISAIYLIPPDVQLFSSSPSETAASKSLQSSPSSAIAL